MTFDEYQRAAQATAIGEHREIRAVLGIAGETGELLNAEADILAELGGLLWYVSELCVQYDLGSLADLMGSNKIPLFTGVPISLCTVAASALRIPERVKKSLRGDDIDLGVELPPLVRELVWMMGLCAQAYGSSLEGVAQMNIEKLAGRQRRGVIQGDGDER